MSSSRRHCLPLALLLCCVAVAQHSSAAPPAGDRIPRVAAIVTVYYHNSHADVLVSRLLETDTLDGKGRRPRLKLASLYIDQFPDNDKGRKLARQHGVPIYNNVADALTLKSGKLAVEGVLLIAEHGMYPESPTGSIMYPKRRLFSQIVDVFEKSGRSVPVFSDKHLSDNWKNSKWIYDTSRRMQFPMMAGSSLPGLWRYPPADVHDKRKLRQILAVSYHRLDTYGFHALEAVQALAERRRGGETGVKSVRCIEGDAVWQAGRRGIYDEKLLQQATSRFKHLPLPKGRTLQQLVKNPVLFTIDYRDGLRANILTLNGAAGEWTAAWKYDDGSSASTLFWTQEARPFQHFGFQLAGVEKMMHSGKETWPVERTLLTSGLLDALLNSRQQGGKQLATPHLNIPYQTDWRWRQPPPPPPGRPIPGQ